MSGVYDLIMGSARPPLNRGPAAAAENRAAILAAARQIFADQGYHAPLYKIAQQAGVSQGVFYRHFPDRLTLGLAVFEDNFTELRAIAASDGPQALEKVWSRLVEFTITDVAFVEMYVEARRTAADYDGSQQLIDLLTPALAKAQEARLISKELTVDDLVLAHRMIYGIVVTSDSETRARTAVSEAMKLTPGLPPLDF